MKLEDRIGMKVGKVMILSVHREGRRSFYNCLCPKCLSVNRFRSDSIHHSGFLGCVCFRKTHGMSDHPLYSVHHTMVARCSDANHERFNDYGDAGVSVCEEWMDVEVFIEWSENNGYKNGLILDRINGTGDYEPGNCRYITPSMSTANTKPKRNSSSKYKGVSSKHNKFVAYCKNKHLGTFSCEKEAALAYDKAAEDEYGACAWLNKKHFPELGE